MSRPEGDIQVRVIKEEMIRPARRRSQTTAENGREEDVEEMFLSAIDILCREMPHNRRVLFYEPGPEYEHLVCTLKRSLGLVLDAFYPLAGRIAKPTDHEHGRVYLACNDMGAAFVEATVDGIITVADLCRNGSFSHSQPPFFDQLVPKIDPVEYSLVPPLLIQVSRFNCGGIALGIAHSHVVCDGNSLWHFMISWAECARGEPISLPPLHARSLLKIENPLQEKARLILDHVEDDDKVVKNDGNHNKINTFHFTKDTVEKLRMKVHRENTSYETICAHIWKHTTKAREHTRDKKVAFISIVNMRSRVKPPLGNAYFGNAMMWTTAVATAGELEDEDLAATTQRIHKSIHCSHNDAFDDLLHWLEVYDRDAIFKACMLNGARLRASSSHNFPIYKVDFGWGKPCVVRCPSAEDVGKIIFFPGSDVHGDIDAVLALPVQIMYRLENDKDFTNP